jgi:hypothetical protein
VLIRLQELDVLCRMCRDREASVVIAVIQCTTRIFRGMLVSLLHIGNTKGADIDAASSVLVMLNQLKRLVVELLSHEHVGVRMRVVKFTEVLLLCYSLPDMNVMMSVSDVFHLLLVPTSHPLLLPATLKDEGDALAELLVTQLGTSMSACVVATVITSIGVVARQRSAATAVPLVRALLHVVSEPPPALSAAQVASVRALVRITFISLLGMNLIPLMPGARVVLRFVIGRLTNHSR